MSAITSPVLHIVQEVLLVFLIAASIVLNFSVVYVICRNKHLRKRTTNIFILNLVISNALMAIFVMPLSLATFIRLGWNVDSVLCKLNGMSSTMLCFASISTLCCISADRYFAVVRPMRYKHVLTPKRALYMLVLVWLGSLCLSCLPLITDYEYHVETNSCSPAWHRSCALYAFMTIFAFGVPLVTLLSTYGMIFSSIRRHTKKVSHWRISTSGPCGSRDSARGDQITGTGRAYDSYLSNSAFDDAKQNCRRIKVKPELYPDNTPTNSMQYLRGVEREEQSTKTRRHDKKFRSHSAGCNHIKPDETFLPCFIQMKAASKTAKPVEFNQELRPRSCSVSLRFSISGLVPGTVSAMYCPDCNHSNDIEHARSYTNLNSSEPSELVYPSDDLNIERIRSHSISLTVTTASSPINGPEFNIPAAFSLNGFMSATDEDSTDLLQRVRETSLLNSHEPSLGDTNQLQPVLAKSDDSKGPFEPTVRQHPQNMFSLPATADRKKVLLRPPITLANPAQFVKATLPAPTPRKIGRSRSRSLSFETSSEESKRTKNSLQVPTMQKTSSPLLRLRAITQFKRKLRVNALPREYKIAKIGFILVLVFFLSWGPYMMVNNCKSSSNTPLWVYRTSMWLVYLSCVLNPIVYALSSKHIRLAFSGYMKCCKRINTRKSEPELIHQTDQRHSETLR